MSLYWHLLSHAVITGARLFDFGRSTPGTGPLSFKRQWGGSDAPLPWAQWSPRGLNATPSPEGKVFRLATGVWSALPLPVTRGLGPSLARLLP